MTYDIKDNIRKTLAGVADAARLRKRMEAFRVVYEKTDRIISGQPVKVAMVMQPPHGLASAPGWTDGETISLNAHVINNDLSSLPMSGIVLHTKAVNYHELCHVLYTPRHSDDIVKWIKDEMGRNPYQQPAATTEYARFMWHAFNALEDQRIEMMFSAKYRPAIPYFEAIALKWLVNNSAHTAEAFPLIHGRRFLPANVRFHAEQAFRLKYGEDLLHRFKECIDAYIGMVYPGDTMRAKIMIKRYAQCVKEMDDQTATDMTTIIMSQDNGGGQGADSKQDHSITKGRALIKEQKSAAEKQDEVQPRTLKAEKPSADQNDDGESEEFEDADGDCEAGDGESEADGPAGDGEAGEAEAITSAQGTSPEQPQFAPESAPEPAEAGGGAGEGNEQSEGTNAMEDAAQAFYDALDELFQDQEFMEELQETAKAVQAVLDGDHAMATGVDLSGSTKAVPQEAIRAAKSTSTVLSRLRTELEEVHNYRQTAGAIHTGRFLQRQPWETDFFKTYEPGSFEEANMEAVILVDLSGSMQYQMEQVSVSLWIAKRALETIDARVTVLGFSDYGYVMYQPEEMVGKTEMKLFKSFNGTCPDPSLQEAYRLLHGSQRNMKLLLTLTDGAWQGNREKQDTIVDALNAEGVVTCLMYLGHSYGEIDAHRHTISQNITDVRAVAMMATKVVEEGLHNMISVLEASHV